MKKKIISLLTIFMIYISLMSCAYGVSASYTVTEMYKFNNARDGAEVEIFIGTTDDSDYTEGNCVITPKYTRIKSDDFGNKIAVFDSFALKKNNYTIKVKRNMTCSDVVTNITGANANLNISSKYLNPSERVESNNKLIIAKAKELTQGCTNDYEKAKNIFEFVNTYITYDMSDKYRNKGALSALKTGRGVCEEYASLFVALCRASNIPARVIEGYSAGYMMEGQEKDADDIRHAWAEIYLKGYGWVPSEVTTSVVSNIGKIPYWDGFLNLSTPSFVFCGISNPEIPQARYKAIEFVKMETKIKLNEKLFFNDISKHWAKENIESLYSKKVVNGYEDGTFKPQNSVTRIEFLVMLSRSLKHNEYYNLDVTNIYYPQDFVNNWAKNDYDRLMQYYGFAAADYTEENGAGYNTLNYVFGDNLQMNKYITREEVVALMAPFLQNTYTDNIPLKDIENSKFKDEIIKSYMNNIIKGYEDGTFNPKGNITRAEMATVLDRYTTK